MPSSRNRGKYRALFAVAVCAFLALASTLLLLYAAARANPDPTRLTRAEEDLARAAYEAHYQAYGTGENPGISPRRPVPRLYPRRASSRDDPSDPLSPGTDAPEPRARSAIVVACATGEILYELNADERIPPASMTKLVSMYVALDAARAGEISLDDAFEPPPYSWAVNMPPRSSLMFLGDGQTVTARELLAGMASVSGNDAAIAIAYRVSGSVPEFVGRMNWAVSGLGLRETRFTEPSGLSERNATTAREFASFCLAYLGDYPEALGAFHSLREFSFPLDGNYADGRRAATVRQAATNRLLGRLPGCDGLKTGYIDESGYNVSLTAERSGERYLAVIMGGAGSNSREGNRIREEDGTALMEWAFSSWSTLDLGDVEPVPITAWGGGPLFAIPAGSGSLAIPKGTLGVAGVETRVVTDPNVTAPVLAGDSVGYVEYSIGDKASYRRPLVADRAVPESSPPVRALDAIARPLAPLFRSR